MLSPVKSLLKSLPVVKDQIARYHAWKRRIKHGHFYSPVPSADDIESFAQSAFESAPSTFPGVDLQPARQLELLGKLGPFHADQPFREAPSGDCRYYFGNDYFSYGDALYLHCLMRYLRPQQVIEVGSGFSSFVMLDTNDRFLDRQTKLTFIDPHPERLQSRLTPTDSHTTEIAVQPVQTFPLRRFEELKANDILFIDSSHVAKLGSDLNHLLFQVLPSLAAGVYIHFHDVFYPFEYPPDWFADRRYWNEAYLLRAFLQFNGQFEISGWLDYLAVMHPAEFAAALPLAVRNVARSCPAQLSPSGSFWLRRL